MTDAQLKTLVTKKWHEANRDLFSSEKCIIDQVAWELEHYIRGEDVKEAVESLRTSNDIKVDMRESIERIFEQNLGKNGNYSDQAMRLVDHILGVNIYGYLN